MSYLQTDENLAFDLLDSQPEPMIYYVPVREKKPGKKLVIDFEVAYCNREYSSQFQLTKDQVIGQRVLSFPGIDERAKGNMFDQLLEVYQSGKENNTINFHPAQDKYYFTFRKKVRNGVLTIARNVTGEIQATKDKESQVDFINNILDNSINGIFACEAIRDAQGEIRDLRITRINPAFTAMVNITEEEALNHTYLQLFPSARENGTFDLNCQVINSGKSVREQIYYKGENLDAWYDVSLSKLGKDGLLVSFTDISESKTMQTNFEKKLEELRKSNSNLEEFAYAASHDLKEPIRKIHYFSERLREKLSDKLDEEEVRMFERMEHATERMQLLVDDLLAYSHVSTNKGDMEQIDLNEKLRKVLNDLELPIEEKKARIWIDPLPTVRGHRIQLAQLFANLIGNSLKYSRPGIPPEINITSKRITGRETGLALQGDDLNRDYYRIEVKDNGIGFDQKDAERIFQVFQRLHGNSEYKGTGVGLSIARKVAQNHGGNITAESKPGEGASFKIFLPAS